MIGPEPDCLKCKHQIENPKGKMFGFYCKAFPDGEGIPNEIFSTQVSHRKPYPGDHGIRFEPA